MLNVAALLLTLAAAAAGWGVVVGVLMHEDLRRRGEQVSFIWLRLMLPAYVQRYARITREEDGTTGPLFYHYVIALNTALALVLIAAVLSSI